MDKILLIEDSTESQLLIQRILAKNYVLTTVETLQKARRLMEEDHSFQLILLDVNLPDGDGFEFITSLRENETYGD